VPGPAARACGQSSAPAGALTTGGDTDPDGAVARHSAPNGHAAGAGDAIAADFDAEAGVGIAGAALRRDLHAPAAIE
jgi:hypothetical protein